MHTLPLRRALLVTGLFLLGLGAATAQNFHMTIGGGLATHYGGARVVGAFKASLGLEFELDQHWSLEPSLCFYGKGWKNKNQTVLYHDEAGDVVYNEDGTPHTGVKERTTTANYLELPLVAHYYMRLKQGSYVVLTAGPYVAVGVSGKQKTKGDPDQEGGRKLFYEDKTFKESGTHRFDAGLTLGLGVQLPSHFTLGLETDLGLCKFNRDGDRNASALVVLTYQF